MKIAIVGSRSIADADLSAFVHEDVTEIISGGAKGVDMTAKEYARKNMIDYKEFLPEYSKYGRAAPIARNKEIVDYADFILIFWDGESRGTKCVIDYCKKSNKEYNVINCNPIEG